MSRFWQSFNTRYNVYFNASQAYIEGDKAKENIHKDDYTKMLPVFLVGNKASQNTGKGNYETAITKCQKAISLHSIKRRPVVNAGKQKNAKTKAYLQRKEYNPFLKNAWLMMGRAQFQKGDFLEAAATFSYITRLYAAEPVVANEARQWMARCYVLEKWYYDADDALKRMRRDTMNTRTKQEADATQAALLLGQERYAEAIPYLQRAARSAKGDFKQARLYYLLGQIYHQQNQPKEAYKALQKCLKKSPPFELAFNARILQTETMAGQRGMGNKMIGKLKRMARSDNNKNYLDQVYYAIGNIHMAQADTAAAISAYEKGRELSTRNGLEKGVLLLRLGEVYWAQHRFDKAQSCYTEAVGMLDKERPDYEDVVRRSAVLDKLVPFTSAVQLQDSLQTLARMSEKDRNAAIDRVIVALKKKEAEELKARKDSAAQARMDKNGQEGNHSGFNKANVSQNAQGNKAWYFYNPMLVMQGKQQFAQIWGKRKNEDDWRRSNRTVVQMDDHEGFDYEADDSLQAARDSLNAIADSTDVAAEGTDSLQNDPHQREYYLKQIPFTEEARVASDAIITDGLYNAGVIEKDDLEDFALAANTLERVVTQYPKCDQLADAYYQLFLLYSRWGRKDKAEEMRNKMATYFAEDERTRLINDPEFEYKARFGREIEDSLYTATYQAYRKRDAQTVEANFAKSTKEYPDGLNRPKFMLVHALSRLNTATTKELIEELRELLQKYPESDVSAMAGMIVKGLESGREIGTGMFDLSSLWDRRTADADEAADEAAKKKQFSAERNAPYLFVLAYATDSIDTNKLLYEMAHFNFTTFVVRGFDMTVQSDKGLNQFVVSGFNSFDEVHAYAQRLFKAKDLQPYLKRGRVMLVSKDNHDLIGTVFSINDYQKFYDKTFAPLQIPESQPVESAPIEQHYEDEYTPEQLERINNDAGSNNSSTDDGEWY